MTSSDQKRRRLTRGLLCAAPGLVAPLVLMAVCVRWFVQEAQGYYALPLAQRTADGDPFSADAGMFFAGMGIAVALLLLAPPLLAGLPSRLRLWAGILAVAIQLVPLWVSSTSVASGNRWGWSAFLLFAYVPTLVAVRLIGQWSGAASQ